MMEAASQSAPLLSTSRLWLTSFQISDAASVFSYATNPNVSRFTTWTPHERIADAEAFIRYAQAKEYCWAIRLSLEGPAIGAIECSRELEGEASIHFVLAEEHWGQGVMTEAAGAVLRRAFSAYPGLQCVRTYAIEENWASKRVLEKCGMSHEGRVLETWKKFEQPVQVAIYAVTREALADPVP